MTTLGYILNKIKFRESNLSPNRLTPTNFDIHLEWIIRVANSSFRLGPYYFLCFLEI